MATASGSLPEGAQPRQRKKGARLVAEAATIAGLSFPLHIVRTWSQAERAARARGEAARPHAERAALAVCQGLIHEEDALLSLCLIQVELRERDGWRPEEGTTAAQQAEIDFRFARHLLLLATNRVDMKRALLAQKLRRELKPMLERWAGVDELIAAAREINHQGGRLFVWPELRQLLSYETEQFMRDQRRQKRGRRHA